MKQILNFVMFLFLITSLTYSQLNIGDVGNKKVNEKAWSKINIDKTIIQNNQTDYIYTPAPQIYKKYKVDGGEAIVSPNFRPFPNASSTQSEMSIDIHPLNMNVVFGSANTTSWPVSGLYGTGGYYTTNGGTSWGGFDIPPFGSNSGDPASVIGTNGNFYLGFIDGGSNYGGQGVAVSTNNGTNWIRHVVAPAPAGTNDLLDKNHLWIDKQVGSPYENRVYAAYTAFVSGSPNNNKVEFRYSTNYGVNWSSAINVSSGTASGSHDQGVNVATGPNGEVYSAWAVYDNWSSGNYGEDAIGFNISTNGGQTWGTAKRVYAAPNFGVRTNPSSPNPVRLASFPSMAVDRSNGVRRGTIYMSWPQIGVTPAGSDMDIVLIKSTNNGTTWTSPVRVNDDPLNNGKRQYFNWMTVDPSTGHVYVVFYDQRNTTTDSAEVYMARSIDGGVTFENIKVSDARFKPKPISGLAGGYHGDYIGITALNNTVYPFWTDDRTGNYQGWSAKVTFGPNITHTPFGNTENLAGPYKISAKFGSAIPLVNSTVKVFWGRGTSGQITDSLLMTPVTADSFFTNIPGNGQSATYNYYISATDETGGNSKYPPGAPSEYISFTASPDQVSPSITHTPLQNQYRELWPATVNALVTDNIGIDTVRVLYKVTTVGTEHSFLLTQGQGANYSGSFNLDTSSISLGDTLYYKIVAKDASVAGNYGYSPQSGYHSFVFVPDVIFPVVNHIPLNNQSKLRWPALVKASATDNLGIKNVWVEYAINNGSTSGAFQLVSNGDNQFQGYFDIDTTQIFVGDTVKYRVKAVDISTSGNTTYNPTNGYHSFAIINTLGIVLVVDDDISLEYRYSEEKAAAPDLVTPLGASANLFLNTLNSAGYLASLVNFNAIDTNSFYNYDVIVLSAGVKTTAIFESAPIRTALTRFIKNGGKTIVEGGEVGYIYRQQSTEKDRDFRWHALLDSSWVSDATTGLLKKRLPDHEIFNLPFSIPDNVALTGTGYGVRDVMRIMPNRSGIFKLGSWSSYADTASIFAYSPTNDVSKISNLHLTFSVGSITNSTIATNLIENSLRLLIQNDGLIPVELTSFSANVNYNKVTLNWNTATEINNAGFSIERKNLNTTSEFSAIGYVEGNGTAIQNNEYRFIDEVQNQGKFVYRLKQIDFDGSYAYSKEIEIDVTSLVTFNLEQNYPNPFNPSTLIKYSIPSDGFVNLSVYNLLGEKVVTLVNEVQKGGSYEHNFNASDLAS
ncbi:MAG TPA: sialidase family protein, partial [Ignavibacteriaceae bacterium]|nr:sialidase family protein [Ignavibacteriaceae bacterium]